jgi:hypothetical protein
MPEFGSQPTVTKARAFDPLADAETAQIAVDKPSASASDKTPIMRKPQSEANGTANPPDAPRQLPFGQSPISALDPGLPPDDLRPGSLIREPGEHDFGDADKPWWWSLHYEPSSPDAIERAGDASVGLRGERWNAMMNDTHGRWKPGVPSSPATPAVQEAALQQVAAGKAKRMRLGTKEEVWQALKDAGGVDDYDAAKADAAYKAWKAGAGPRPEPFQGGHFDEVNGELGGAKVSGGREAFDRLTRGERYWDEINTAIHKLRSVPGLENLRLPDHIEEAVQRAKAAGMADDTSFNFGANVDPKKAQRGFGSLDVLATLGGIKPAKMAAQAAGKYVAAPAATAMGKAIERSAGKTLTADAAARYASTDPSVLMSLASDKGTVGGLARAIMQAVQQGNTQDIRAKTALLSAEPQFRMMFAGGQGQQPTQAAGAH